MAMGLLARREHSRRELHDKLRQKGYADTIITRVIAELETDRFQSDERFTDSLIRTRRDRGYGPIRIQKELQEKGIAPELIDRLLNLSAQEWMDSLQRVWRKKFGDKIPKSYAERARQARFLHYRGFTSDQCQQVLNPRE
jgi:regulatory protein